MDLEIESQKTKTSHSADRHEGNFPNNDDTKALPVEDGPTTALPDASKKTKGLKNEKKAPGKPDKKGKKGKSGKSKKASPANSESSSGSSEDGFTNSSSDESTDTESASGSEERAKKKKIQKKRQDLRKAKKLIKSSKTSTKQSKSQIKASESNTSDTDAEDEDGSHLGKKGGMGEAAERELTKLRLQVEQLLRQTGSMDLTYNPPGGPTSSLNQGAPRIGIQGGLVGGLNSGGYQFSPDAPMIGYHDAYYDNRYPPPGASMGYNDAYLDGSAGRNMESKTKDARDTKPVAQRLEFKRVDQVWDSQIHNYKLQDTAEDASSSQYDEYLFHVRRTFDWEGKYKTTIVDIKSKQLREALKDIIGNVKGVSLVEETPKLDPKMLFLYLEDMRTYVKNLKDLEPEGDSRKERRKVQKWIDEKRRHLRVLIKHIDTDFSETKKSLYPMLENGLITFDLLWALWKPNTLAYATTYGSVDEPRVFKVEVAEKHYSIVRGEFYYIEGKYFEYDGKQFGYGSMSEEITEFRGARKITSLGCYPLKYHKNEVQLRKDLIERGKKFVSLGGVHYKGHQGMAYHKKKKSVIKVNINGRIMVDPAIHRRINPNYPVSLVRPKDHDVLSDDDDSDDEAEDCGCDSGDDTGGTGDAGLEGAAGDGSGKVKFVTKVYKDNKGNVRTVRVPKDFIDSETPKEKLDQVPSKDEKEKGKNDESGKNDEVGAGEDGNADTPPVFTDEEYLIASPVVLGFAFAEKLWLEFTVSGIKEISWNEHAYDSLVLQSNTKEIVKNPKALVESHKYHPAASIDDVIQGKGKGLVAVLHGPPGTGKTLTAEGISEYLKCPLYMVSAGDLGTDSRYLEAELQKILDICHAWGAILLLDEADVFLEKRNMHDIHRNALVSIFLRQLEYFQGILFLTTNRVQTFDDAFQSRIHIALRYDDLDVKAKKAIFKIFIERARVVAGIDLMPFDEEDYTSLARHNLNGRQIKNTIGTAQALAVNKGEPLSMRHIREVLNVQQNFEQDLKGGTGYQDAMRSYF
ncbi:putative aaa family atpase protein [Daldinia childiae]|uniref:putative aaa family atpase protein n=1 Tax=Daldinia childiae TaxID=326645 RepID=UPI0014487515|nr:putative aaa family atpase protein [Daldinia childiae]KAF3065892.1 putative aaa family atpase protein [Daldinia childiae]